MNSDHGGPTSDKQRQAASDLARKRVLSAYANHPETYADSKPTLNEADWKKYHTAWQDYYQKYYGDYYNKAAHTYIASEKEKISAEVSAGVKSDKKSPETPAEASKVKAFRAKLRAKTSDRAHKLRKSRHFIPLLVGAAVVLVLLFLQYNRNIFAPLIAYISPGNVAATEITEIDPTVSRAPGPDPKLIIPKINVEVPVNFGVGNDTKSLNAAMENGVAQFSIPGASALPGELGNLVLSGHSAGDVYNTTNQYKFIFSGLERLTTGDLVYVNYESKRYTYIITDKKVVAPTDVAALIFPADKPRLTLITCTPLGTSEKRLLLIADQISPSPDAATTPEQTTTQEPDSSEMPTNPPTFFEQIWNFITGQS
jgi:sortase A